MVLPLDDSPLDSVSHPGAAPTHDEFFSWPKARQAELVFDELFLKRTPLSEARRGVITVLQKLGLEPLLREARAAPPPRRLDALRAWFAEQDPAEYVEKVFALAEIRYAVMTNIPFAAEEAQYWMADPQTGAVPPVPACLKPALRVDPLMVGDWAGISAVLARCSPPYPLTLEGCHAFIVDWVRRMKPLYLMASTPHGFSLPPASTTTAATTTITATATATAATIAAAGAEPPTRAQLLEEVLLRVAAAEGLPIALKVGAVRGANPSLRGGGDAVEVADLSFVRQLCVRYPAVKFLLTVLSQDNQHELCVLARKFGNLHVYGCWWFCNNPSIIGSTTRMRLEMLGTAFTCQLSDSRVLDQLLYKWPHSREVIWPLLVEQYQNLIHAGWEVREEMVQRDVALLFGGAFEAFMAK